MMTPLGNGRRALRKWLDLVVSQLIIGGPPAAPPVAYDGVAGTEPASSFITATFAGSTITRPSGSFEVDGWRIGMMLKVTLSGSNNGIYQSVLNVAVSTLTLTSNVVFTAEGPTVGVQLDGSVVDGFALYVGPQWLDRWTGANVCTIVPSYGEPSTLAALHTVGVPEPLGAISMGIDVHVWGDEDASQARDSQSIWHDIERYSTEEILQNVTRAIHYASAVELVTVGQIDGWQNETEILRFGEAFVYRMAVSIPYYDFDQALVPLPQSLDPRVSIEQPGE